MPLPDRIHYAAEKFYTALRELTGASSQRERLANAYLYHLAYVTPEMLPETMRFRFNEFREAISRVPSADGAVKVTIAQMSDDDVAGMVRQLLALHEELQTALLPSGRLPRLSVISGVGPKPVRGMD